MTRDPVCGMEVGATGFLEKEREGGSPCAKRTSIAYGILGAGALLAVFFAVVTLSNGSFPSAVDEGKKIWYWIVLLAGGFGLQLGLFVYLKRVVQEHMAGATAEVAAAGTVSTGSMVACCSHALVNLLPILGISAAATLLARYQLPLLLLGVFSNLVGLTIMIGLFQRHRLLAADNVVNRVNMKTTRLVFIVSGLAAIGYSILLAV